MDIFGMEPPLWLLWFYLLGVVLTALYLLYDAGPDQAEVIPSFGVAIFWPALVLLTLVVLVLLVASKMWRVLLKEERDWSL